MTNPIYDDARNAGLPKHAMLGPYDSPGEYQAFMYRPTESAGYWVLTTGNYDPNEKPRH